MRRDFSNRQRSDSLSKLSVLVWCATGLVCMPDRIPTALIAARRRGCPRDCNRRCFIGSGEGGDRELFWSIPVWSSRILSAAHMQRTNQVFLRRGVAVFNSELPASLKFQFALSAI